MSLASGRTCSNCGYDLTGIKGLRGVCPECGGFWDVMTGKGLGAARSESRQRTDRIVARIRTASIAAFGLMILACGGFGSFLANQMGNPMYYRPLAIAAAVASVVFLGAMLSYLSERE